MIRALLAPWLLLVCLVHAVLGNTEISTFGPVLCDGNALGRAQVAAARRLASDWPALNASTSPHLYGTTTNAKDGVWLALHPTTLSERTDRARLWWPLTQRYQLRLSWPANLPANFDVEIFTPAEALATGAATVEPLQDGVPDEPAQPCPLLLARIRTRASGIRIPAGTRQPASALLRAAEAAFSWAAPQREVPADRPMPLHVTFEHVHLGFIPATAVPMAAWLAAAVALSLLFARLLVDRPVAKSE